MDDDIPVTLFPAVDAQHLHPGRDVSLRVPRLRVRRVTWALPSVDLLSNLVDTLTDVEELCFDYAFNGSLAARAWPSRLRVIKCHWASHLNRSINGVAWSASLHQLTFGCDFKQEIVGVACPTSIEELAFGKSFNQTMQQVRWPASLQRLTFGQCFNQPI